MRSWTGVELLIICLFETLAGRKRQLSRICAHGNKQCTTRPKRGSTVTSALNHNWQSRNLLCEIMDWGWIADHMTFWNSGWSEMSIESDLCSLQQAVWRDPSEIQWQVPWVIIDNHATSRVRSWTGVLNLHLSPIFELSWERRPRRKWSFWISLSKFKE